MKRVSGIRGSAAILLLAVLLAVVSAAGKRGLSEIAAQEPRYEIKRWRDGSPQPDDSRLARLGAGLKRASELDPANPNLTEDLARFHVDRVEHGKPYDTDVRAARQEALDYFRLALAQRPTSGHAWVNVAFIKLNLGMVDREFSASLEQAFRRSPWEGRVQLIAIELGLASWQAISEDNRKQVERAIRAQSQWKLLNQKPALLALLKRYGRPDLECLLEAAPADCPAVRA